MDKSLALLAVDKGHKETELPIKVMLIEDLEYLTRSNGVHFQIRSVKAIG
jgi:hypothetical protein